MQGTLQASFIKFGLVVSKLSFEVIVEDGRPLMLKAHEHCMFTRYAAIVLQINILFKVTRVYRLNVTSPLYSVLNFSIIFQKISGSKHVSFYLIFKTKNITQQFLIFLFIFQH